MPPVQLDKLPHTLPSPELFQAYVDWLVKNGVLSRAGAAGRGLMPPIYEEVVWTGRAEQPAAGD